MKIFSLAIAFLLFDSVCFGAAMHDRAARSSIWPIGDPVSLEGIVIDGPDKGYESGPNLCVQKIQGRPTQDFIRILLRNPAATELKRGATYWLDGFTTGTYVGGGGPLVQTTARYFRREFVIQNARSIKPIFFAPEMFPGARALIQGKAESSNGKSLMTGNGWSVVVVQNAPWPKEIEGKPIETLGIYKQTSGSNTYDLINGEWRLVRLEDQVGRDVNLRGVALSLNDEWWFNYRGIPVAVENMARLPGWTPDQHGRPMEIRGRLETTSVHEAPVAGRNLNFIVRRPVWSPLPNLLSPEIPLGEFE